jgi:16S rRNA C1402 N4-methylase RsmH
VRVIIKNKHKLKTTFDLKKILKDNGISEKKIAVVFQVLRIEVNNELKQLEDFLEKFANCLNPL